MTQAKVESVRVYLEWYALEAGQWKPVKFLPQLASGNPLRVAVDVPLEPDYIANLDKNIVASLMGDKAEEVVLTPKGMAYVRHQIEVSLDPAELDDNEETPSEGWEPLE